MKTVRSPFARSTGIPRACAILLATACAGVLLPASVYGADAPSTNAPNATLPVTVDLRPSFEKWSLTPRRQGARPTCSTFTVTGALEYALAKRIGQGTRLSVEFLNWAANGACGDREDGGFFSDLWKGFALHGICAEPEMPYQVTFDAAAIPSVGATNDAHRRLSSPLRWHWIKEWDVTSGLTDDHLAAIKRTLYHGWPVCGGFRWPKHELWKEGVLQMCGPGNVRDGHSVLLVGYREDAAQPGGGVFIFRNTSGDAQDGAMPFQYAREYMNDAAWIDFPISR